MNFAEFLAPFIRRKNQFLISFFLVFGFCMSVFFMLPQTERTTLYFSLKPLTTNSDSYVLSNGIEEGSKVAETIAGWAKNPGFRQDILKEANLDIPKFKRKLSAQRQNRLNVFWTLKLSGKETQYSDEITEALTTVLDRNMAEFNDNNAFPFGYSEPSLFQEKRPIPLSLQIIISLSIAFMGSLFGFFIIASIQERLLFTSQIRDLFPKSPILNIKTEIGSHDEVLLKYFLSTFPNPQLLGGFKEAEKFFDLQTLQTLQRESDTPVILVRLWDTKREDLENFKALFDDNVAFILFER